MLWLLLRQAIEVRTWRNNYFLQVKPQYRQATLGDTVDIPTVHGDVELVIPETQTGETIPPTCARELRAYVVVLFGDQYVTIVSWLRQVWTNDKKAALKEFAAAGDLKVNPKKKNCLTI